MTPGQPLAEERDALRQILARLMAEEISLDNLCKHVPRVASVAANVARIQSVLESAAKADGTDDLLKALAELSSEGDSAEDSW
jgi:hypothetical protein